MRKPTSDIPSEVVEKLVHDYRQDGAFTFYRRTDCLLDGRLVGQRAYAGDGQLVIETPLKDNLKHGREYTWNEDGSLLLMEPHVKGRPHGTAKQYGSGGKPIGTYRLVHGTGLDIWRHEQEDGRVVISEIHSLRAGLPHGYEWWFVADQRSLWHERHWYAGEHHGIERMWNRLGGLRRGYPKYWVAGRAVPQRKYLDAARADKTLPAFRVKDNLRRRSFPPEIRRLLSA